MGVVVFAQDISDRLRRANLIKPLDVVVGISLSRVPHSKKALIFQKATAHFGRVVYQEPLAWKNENVVCFTKKNSVGDRFSFPSLL